MINVDDILKNYHTVFYNDSPDTQESAKSLEDIKLLIKEILEQYTELIVKNAEIDVIYPDTTGRSQNLPIDLDELEYKLSESSIRDCLKQVNFGV